MATPERTANARLPVLGGVQTRAQRLRENKMLRTKSIVGTKAERQQFKSQKQAITRERSLAAMSPDQRKAAEKKESETKAQSEAQAKAKADAKTRRTVGKVGNQEEREQFRADKARVKRDDRLAAMSPEERKRALANETANKAREAAEAQRATEAKAARTVAIVGDKAARQAFDSKPDPAAEAAPKPSKEAAEPTAVTRPLAAAGTPTRMIDPDHAILQSRLGDAFSQLNQTLALLS